MKRWLKEKIRGYLGVSGLESSLLESLERFIELEGLVEGQRRKLGRIDDLLNQHTSAGIDVDTRGGSFVVMVGRYRNHDYVQCVSLENGDFSKLVSEVKSIRRSYPNSRLDVMPSLRGAFESGRYH